MSSKLYRGGHVPAEAVAWHRVAPVDPGFDDADSFPAASYPPLAGCSRVGSAPERAMGGEAQAAYERGFEEGQAAARQEIAAELTNINTRAARAIEELSGLRPRFRHEAEEDVVALAIAIARRILHRELTIAPEALLGLVKAALAKMESRELHRVRVARPDAAMVGQFLEKIGTPAHVEVVGDPALDRGALIFEAARGELDASVETQFAEIERGFADLVRRAS